MIAPGLLPFWQEVIFTKAFGTAGYFSMASVPGLDVRALCRQLRVVLQLLYPTPTSILTLVTWVPQSRLAFGHSARRLAIGPPALAKPNPTASLAAGGYDWPCGPIESLFLLSPARCLIVRPYYTAPSCLTVVLTTTFTPEE